MRQLTKYIAFITLVAVSWQSAAQFQEDTKVYEKKDKEGVPSYSNIPSQGAQPVIIPPTNLADSVAVTPAEAKAAATEPQQAAPEPGTPEFQQKVMRELEEFRQRERETRRERHGETRHKVGHEDSARRDEVGDSDESP